MRYPFVMAPRDPVVYRIDEKDDLSFVNDEWDAFAAAAGVGEIRGEKILARSLWDFIADPTTRHLYQEIVSRARAGHRVRLPIRCDAAEQRRFVELEVSAAPEGVVEFVSRTVSVESRPPESLLAAGSTGYDARMMIRMCSWCKKVRAGDEWLEVEEAAAKLRMFESGALPWVSHGICEACEKKVLSAL
jgi:hypothetical protein